MDFNRILSQVTADLVVENSLAFSATES